MNLIKKIFKSKKNNLNDINYFNISDEQIRIIKMINNIEQNTGIKINPNDRNSDFMLNNRINYIINCLVGKNYIDLASLLEKMCLSMNPSDVYAFLISFNYEVDFKFKDINFNSTDIEIIRNWKNYRGDCIKYAENDDIYINSKMDPNVIFENCTFDIDSMSIEDLVNYKPNNKLAFDNIFYDGNYGYIILNREEKYLKNLFVGSKLINCKFKDKVKVKKHDN